MTAVDNFDARLQQWLQESAPTSAPADVHSGAIERARRRAMERAGRRTLRRPQWWTVPRFAMTVAILLVAVLTAGLLQRTVINQPGAVPTSTPTAGRTQSPSASPTASPRSTPRALPDSVLLTAGMQTYVKPLTNVSDYKSVSFTLPDGWANVGNLFYKRVPRDESIAFSFWDIRSLYRDPCRWETGGQAEFRFGHVHRDDGSIFLENGVGPFAEQDRAASPPTEVPLGGQQAIRMELYVPESLDLQTCDLGEYRTWLGAAGQPHSDHAAGQTDIIFFVDVDRNPLAIDASYMPDTSAADIAELMEIIDSMHVSR